ncbi:phosphoribosylaminoimidazolecarboxamide formyltransferase [Micromonospora nigra]|uniref:Phosphoribosylaminoimidazolecarboxamide formyltransferase n=1 Tax=Micromonospora nigra TaxID=145857 RepID=A0A1C6RCU1_9ACTN|nr:phosphoribosylaminoimidazolecarboxamide formyltransferase [Micromonospora nigra]SCL14971.1 phosphoribosylaminoimidazolecarboxamide formyltransferase [Micromonospora nigra]
MLAVLAVSDKRDVDRLAMGLLGLGWDVVATEGTRRLLAEHGVEVGAVADLAGVPTLLGGRVKTLTVSLMGGILARDDPADLAEVAQHGISRVDLVACNYYLLPERAPRMSFEEFREKIDVGGPAMLRAAAKNCAHVVPLSDPDDYPVVLKELAEGGVSPERRIALARKAFDISAAYDASISRLFAAAGT